MSRAVFVAVLLGALTAGRAEGQKDDPKYFPESRPDLHELLAEALYLGHTETTPLALARLATTPALVAKMVLEDDVADFLANARNGGHLTYYGVWLALHVGVIPRQDRLEFLYGARMRAEPIGQLAGHLLIRTVTNPQLYRFWWERARLWEPELERRAIEFLSLRMPLDGEILQELDGQARGKRLTAGQVERLSKLWHLLDDSGASYLAAHRKNLAPLLSRMVELRGMEPRRAAKGK